MIAMLNSLDTITLRIETVAIKRKFMESCFTSHNIREKSAKSICWNSFLSVVVLQNATDSPQGLDILIPIWITIMKRISLSLRAIRSCKVNSNM